MSRALPLRGRDAPLAALGERLAAARRGEGSVVLLIAEAGMGKTRMLDEAGAMAVRAGLTTGRGTCAPEAGVAPLAPLLSALRDPPAALLDPEALVGEIGRGLERAALGAPLLLALDDLQWADAATVAALGPLTRTLADLPIVWLLALRPRATGAEVRALLADLRGDGAHDLTLEPLDDAAAEQVGADVLGLPAEAALLELLGEAAGNPFTLVELLLGLREDGLVGAEDGVATLRERRLPARLRETMRQRLGRLEPAARQTAAVAAALGRSCTRAQLAAMLEVPAPVVAAAVAELAGADLVDAEAGDSVAFRHDLLRQAVLDTLAATALAALRRQAADVLLADGAAPAAVAGLLVAGARPGDGAAVRTLLAAGRALALSDPSRAADLTHHAFGLAAADDPLRGELVAETALHLHAAGRADEGAAFAEAWIGEVATAEQHAEVLLRVTEMYSLSATARAAASRRALALEGVTPAMRARHLAQLVTNLVGGGQIAQADATVAAARAAVAAAGDAAASALLEVTELTLGAAHGRHSALVDRCDLVIDQRAGQLDDRRTQFARLMRSTALRQLGALDASLAASDQGFLNALRQGQGWAVRMGQEGRGIILLELGRIADAIAVLESLFRPAPPEALPNVAQGAAFVALATAALHAGDARIAALCTTIAERTARSDTPEMRRHATWVLALQAQGRGEVAAAHDQLAALGADAGEAILPRYPSSPADVVALVRLAVDGGDAGLARDTVALARARARENPSSGYLQGLAEHADGLATGDPALLAAAAERLAGEAAPLAHASALEDLGTASGVAREPTVARLDQALALHEATGATWDAARVRGRLRGLGVRRVAAGPRAADGDLTDAERRVIDLVAAGLTNRDVAERLYVSPHTVNTHLRHAFAKLGVRSRRELILKSAETAP